MKSLYVFLTGSLATASGYGRGQVERHQHVVDVAAVEEELLPLDPFDDEAERLVEPTRGSLSAEHAQGQAAGAAGAGLRGRGGDERAADPGAVAPAGRPRCR